MASSARVLTDRSPRKTAACLSAPQTGCQGPTGLGWAPAWITAGLPAPHSFCSGWSRSSVRQPMSATRLCRPGPSRSTGSARRGSPPSSAARPTRRSTSPTGLPHLRLEAAPQKRVGSHLAPRSCRACWTRSRAIIENQLCSELDKGRDVLAGGRRDLSPAQRALAGDGDVLARGPGLHAEETAVKGARSAGLTPHALGVSRPICPACRSFHEATGATITGPNSARWD